MPEPSIFDGQTVDKATSCARDEREVKPVQPEKTEASTGGKPFSIGLTADEAVQEALLLPLACLEGLGAEDFLLLFF